LCTINFPPELILRDPIVAVALDVVSERVPPELIDTDPVWVILASISTKAPATIVTLSLGAGTELSDHVDG